MKHSWFAICSFALAQISTASACDKLALDGRWEIFRTTTTYPEYHLVAHDYLDIWYLGASEDKFSVETIESKWTVVPQSTKYQCNGDKLVLEVDIRNRGCIHELKIKRTMGDELETLPDGRKPDRQIDVRYADHKGSCPTTVHLGSHRSTDPGHSHGYD